MAGKFHRRRPVGRPRLRREENIRRGSSLLLNIRERTLSGGKDIWRRTAEKAKAPCGLWRHCRKRSTYALHCSWVIAVRIVTVLRGWRTKIGLRCSAGTIQRQGLPLGHTQPLIQWVPAVPSPGVERPGREANYPL
jgi:hypothetical protein